MVFIGRLVFILRNFGLKDNVKHIRELTRYDLEERKRRGREEGRQQTKMDVTGVAGYLWRKDALAIGSLIVRAAFIACVSQSSVGA